MYLFVLVHFCLRLCKYPFINLLLKVFMINQEEIKL